MGKISNVRQVKLKGLKPYENNAKIHGQKQIDRLKDSISEFGFVNPILIDESGVVIAGHGRLEAAKEVSGLLQVITTQRMRHLLTFTRERQIRGLWAVHSHKATSSILLQRGTRPRELLPEREPTRYPSWGISTKQDFWLMSVMRTGTLTENTEPQQDS